MSDARQPDHAALLKRALLAIDQLEAKLAAVERGRREPIAIVGIGCRFPQGADTPEAFWELLRSGTDAVTEVPPERWDVDAFYDPDPDKPGKSYTRWGSFVRDVDRFDPAFFGVSPREAVSMDPQQRLLLEVAWEALEHAAIAPASLAGSATAVYVGITTHDYAMQLAEAVGSRNGDAYTPSGTAHSVAAGRLSYVLGLHGPNVAIDTACSSSLVAMHWALQSLRSGEADLALAGGVNLTLTPDGSVLTSRARMMSFDGHCKTFDASADGYVRGEGCGMLVLKRLSDAQRDGDRVLAVVRGSALNQDGRSSGLTAPNGRAQEAVIRAALSSAGLKPAEVSYVEAHGTGTPLGDPIEIKALNAVYGERPAEAPLLVGSVKTNIGHLEAAAGIAGVIKTVLALQHRTVPPHLHLRNPNPLIDWAACAVRIPTQATPWTSEAAPRRAGISSFGFSGTNAHVILEEAPPAAAVPEQPGAQPLLLSAQTPAALSALAGRLSEALGAPQPPSLDRVAATLALGRSHLVERCAFVAADLADARDKLAALAAGDMPAAAARGRSASGAPEIVFLFTGQGAQYPGMARGLYEAEPAFRAALDDCARVLDGELPRPLLEVVFGVDDAAAAALDDTAFTQPALFAVEYALSRLWRHWGVEPTSVMGHSVGEFVAACVAGVFALDDALRLIAARGRLMSALPRDGGMAAVFADEARVREALRGHEAVLSVAATNGPQSTVIAGRSDALAEVLAQLAAAGVETQALKVSHAFHSPLMDPMLDAFERLVAATPRSAPRIGVLSNLSGRLAGEELTEPGYWRRHVREAVRFAESIDTLQKDGYRLYLEIGPMPTLLGMAQRCEVAADSTWVASLRKGRDDRAAMLEAAGALHVLGVRLDWPTVLGADARRRRDVLPRYPFQREHFWQDLHGGMAARHSLQALRQPHPMLAGLLPSPLPLLCAEIGLPTHPWLRDHRIFDFTLFPGTGYLELALAAARELPGAPAMAVHGLEIREALRLQDEQSVELQVLVSAGADGTQQVQVHSRANDAAASPWRLHALCTLAPVDGAAAPAEPLDALRARLQVRVDATDYQARLERQGAHYGPAFRGLVEICREGGEALGRVELPEAHRDDAAAMSLHPALLDACFQLVGAALDWSADDGSELCVPTGLGEYRLLRPGMAAGWCHARVAAAADDPGLFRADLLLYADDGTVIARLQGLELRHTTRAALERVLGGGAPRDWLFETTWPAQDDKAEPAPLPGGRWLLLADGDGVADGLRVQFEQVGAQSIRVRAGTALATDGTDWTLDPERADHWRTLLGMAASAGIPLAGIVVLWATQAHAAPASDIAAVEAEQRRLLARCLALAQGATDTSARLWFVTRGSQSIAGEAPDLVQAPAWGLAGVLAAELPALRCARVDLDPAAGADAAASLFEVLRHAGAEDRIAVRQGRRLVARLTPSTAAPAHERPLCLEISERGTLENLVLRESPRQPPAAGQVEIRVQATGLNFRDVLNALGMYPGDPGPLGNECAGVVSAVGADVTEFRPGDAVVAMVDRSFATWVTAPASLTAHKPDSLGFAEAATIPVTFLTAQYALRDLARIKKGDRVLIHAITGGVGMAALQLALRAGAEVFGTAGTPAKRALAKALGAHHVADSRSLSFADDVRRASDGQGVDIVLNSLAGDFIPESLKLLRPGGHFVEIGKTGIWDAARVAAEFPGRHYHPLYLGEIAAARPLFVRGMLEEILADIGSGSLSALPMRCYPLAQAEQAFRFMGQGHHTGKIVITQTPVPDVRGDASYLVTGGLGGLGLACAQWLAQAGARHLVLLGRRPAGESARAAIDALRDDGCAVEVVAGDVADRHVVDALLQPRAGTPPLRGIVHAAGSVDDGLLAELDMSRFDAVMAPKVRGTWNLHAATAGRALDFFVTFSSGAALLGSPGQGNYAAANAYMDALAHARRAQGLHALSINWGSWSDVGMAAAVDLQHRRRWEAMGLAMIAPQDGVRMLEQMLRANRHAQAAALPLVRSRLGSDLSPFFALLKPSASTPRPGIAAAPAAAPVDLRPRLAQAGSPAERRSLMAEFLAGQVVKVLALPSSAPVDRQRSLMDLGMDSLMAMELRNRIQSATALRVAVADLLKGPSIDSLADDLLQQFDPAQAGPPPDAGTASATGWEEGTL
ncbi:type I polyketide synthase [Variovorax sp. YR752]|uniref:type I polyketide synthase n=1 Tax=Variovorax sp. YR752 TaxID=1884383 RepID=UPI0031380EB1